MRRAHWAVTRWLGKGPTGTAEWVIRRSTQPPGPAASDGPEHRAACTGACTCCRAFCPGPHSTLAVSWVPGEQGAVTRQMPHRSVCERSCASTACIVPPGVSLWHAALHCSRLVSHTLAYLCLTREARAVAPPQPLGPAGRTSSVSRASVMSCRKERWSGSSPPGWGGRPQSRCPWRLHCRCVVGPRLKASCPGGPYAQGCRRRPRPDQ